MNSLETLSELQCAQKVARNLLRMGVYDIPQYKAFVLDICKIYNKKTGHLVSVCGFEDCLEVLKSVQCGWDCSKMPLSHGRCTYHSIIERRALQARTRARKRAKCYPDQLQKH